MYQLVAIYLFQVSVIFRFWGGVRLFPMCGCFCPAAINESEGIADGPNILMQPLFSPPTDTTKYNSQIKRNVTCDFPPPPQTEYPIRDRTTDGAFEQKYVRWLAFTIVRGSFSPIPSKLKANYSANE